MIYDPSWTAVVVFLLFVVGTVGLSFFLGRRAKSSEGYFAAHGQIPWVVNGVAFAGDYLSAASFLGICGMIAAYGYDGFLYSIGFLAGWIVALFVIAEPMKRLGRFTFADALDAQFNSRGIKGAAGISTLVVSVFYLIPQMVGAGSLIQPLLGYPHWVGVVMVGVVVITIVVTAGMVSTTWVQFLKGSLLVIFSFILVIMLLQRGFSTNDTAFETIGPIAAGQLDGEQISGREVLPPDDGWRPPPAAVKITASSTTATVTQPAHGYADNDVVKIEGATEPSYNGNWTISNVTEDTYDYTMLTEQASPASGNPNASKILYVRLASVDQAGYDIFRVASIEGSNEVLMREGQTVSGAGDNKMINGAPNGTGPDQRQLQPIGYLSKLPNGQTETGPVGPISFFTTLNDSEIMLWSSDTIRHDDDTTTTVYYQKPTQGERVLRPGEHPKFKGIRSGKTTDRLNFLSLMLALFCGTASLPHILIRYYTVKDGAAARKSTIVGIATIGFFYILTLYLGLGAMTSGALDLTDSNMSAPLLANSIRSWLFAVISAIAFTTVLGTVSGLILASSGAVAHDLLDGVFGVKLSGPKQVRVAKIAAVIVGGIAIVLGVLFKELNVGYLVGWAFSVAASANLPALVMLLFWKGTTKQGIVASVLVGMISSLGWILLSADTYKSVYGIDPENAIAPFSQPGIVTIPLAFLTLIVVSLITRKPAEA
ncbi:MAG: cation acetate symporter [Rubripirellula sp.]|jgi:cation/acetate symporter|nr:cation acetate symporter [Rubripirellula sp.]